MKAPRFLRWLVRLLPFDTREAHGREIEQVLTAAAADAPRRPLARIRFWIAAAFDVLRVAPRQHADAVVRDVRYAIRTFRRAPAFSLAAILTIGLGVGAATAVFAVVNAVLLRPLPYTDPEKVVLVWALNADGNRTWLSAPELDDLRERVPALSSVTGLTDIHFALTGVGAPEELAVVGVSSTLFPLLGVDVQAGRGFTPEDDRENAARTVILSDGLWRRRFGARYDVLGSSVLLDGRPYTVVGIAPRSFAVLPPSSVFPARVDAWVTLQNHLPSRSRDVRYLHAIGRLTPAASEAILQAQLAAARSERSESKGFTAVPMDRDVVRDIRPALLVLFATVALVLLMACANVAALLLSRAMGRQREIAVRAAIGASPARITRQLITEGLVLSFVGGVLGIALASAAPLIATLPPLASMPRFDQVAIDWRVAAFAFALAAVTGLLITLLPLRELRRRRGTLAPDVLRTTARPNGAIRAGRVLVVTQIAVAVTVLVVALMLARGFASLLSGDPGFDSRGVWTLRVALPAKYRTPADVSRFYDNALERIRAVPGVQSAAAVTQLPLSGALLGSRFTLESAAPSAEVDVDLRGVTPDYFSALGIALLQGRGFTTADIATSPGVAVVDETFARRAWPGESAIGKRIRWFRQPDRSLEVVGVVRAIRHRGLEAPPRETVYRPHTQYARWTMTVVASCGFRLQAEGTCRAEDIAAAIHQVDPDQPVADVTTLDALVNRSLAQPGFATGLASALALIAVLLTIVGTYGLASYAVTERRREIGIRLALGAEPSGVRRLVLGEGVRFAAAGLLIGLPLAALASAAVSRRMPVAGNADPSILAAVAIGLVLTTAAACWLPARRASRVSPAEPLKSE